MDHHHALSSFHWTNILDPAKPFSSRPSLFILFAYPWPCPAGGCGLSFTEFWCSPDFLFQTEEIAGPLPSSHPNGVPSQERKSGSLQLRGPMVVKWAPPLLTPWLYYLFSLALPFTNRSKLQWPEYKGACHPAVWRTRNPAVPKLIGSAATPSTQGLFDGSSLTVKITSKWL